MVCNHSHKQGRKAGIDRQAAKLLVLVLSKDSWQKENYIISSALLRADLQSGFALMFPENNGKIYRLFSENSL